MSTRYVDTKVNISDNQKDKIKKAISEGTAVTIQFTHDDLKLEIPTQTLAFTKSQLGKLSKALNDGVGVRIKMSKTQLEHNKQLEDGFIGPLIAGLASAVLPSLASFVMDERTGKGIYLKRGDNLTKLKQLGKGLYLRPYKDPTQFTSGDGLYFKTGNGY
jgi:hypothetical protein